MDIDKELSKRRKENYLIWTAFVILTFVIYMLFSSGDYSFILTLAAGIQCFGFVLVIATIKKTGDVSGVSWNTFCCCGLALAGRLASILVYEGYLPVDTSGDYVYRIFELTSLLCCLMTLQQMKNSLTRQSQEQLEYLKWYYLSPPMLILACLVHPGLNQNSILDILWTFGLYLECFALLPQIILFSKRGDIEDHTSNFVAAQVLSKAIAFVFWLSSFGELNESNHDQTISILPHYSGVFVIGAQFIQILLTADFLYLYLKSWKTGIPMANLPH